MQFVLLNTFYCIEWIKIICNPLSLTFMFTNCFSLISTFSFPIFILPICASLQDNFGMVSSVESILCSLRFYVEGSTWREFILKISFITGTGSSPVCTIAKMINMHKAWCQVNCCLMGHAILGNKRRDEVNLNTQP